MTFHRWVAAVVLIAGVAAMSRTAGADSDPWTAGSSWLYLRGGYSKNAAIGAGNGGAGYGFGFRHMLWSTKVDRWGYGGHRPLGWVHWTLLKHWSFGGFVEYDVLGRLNTASEIEVPAALDLTRHLMWKGAAKPYVSFGFGAFHRKTYRTGDDFSKTSIGSFVATGFDARIADRQLLGFDARLARVPNENSPPNPVFGGGASTATHWSLKLQYAVTY